MQSRNTPPHRSVPPYRKRRHDACAAPAVAVGVGARVGAQAPCLRASMMCDAGIVLAQQDVSCDYGIVLAQASCSPTRRSSSSRCSASPSPTRSPRVRGARARRVFLPAAPAQNTRRPRPPPRVAFAKRAWLKSVGGEGMKERRGSDGLEGSGGEGAKGREPSKASLIKISYFI